MKLYMHPVSTTSRPVMQFIADEGMNVEMQVIDLFTGEHTKEPFAKINPNKLIPVLEDGDFHLTESSAILKYLADKANSAAYPKDLKQRARVNEVMDWLNSNLYRDYAYNLIYPQVFPPHKRPSEEAQKVTLNWGKEKSQGWLKILNDHIIGPKNNYLCGDKITIADYLGASMVSLGEVIHCNLAQYPNIARWLANMKKRPSWAKVYEVFNGFVESTKSQQFAAV